MKLKGVEVDGLIDRLKAEHEETLFQRLTTAAADLKRIQRNHTEEFGKLKAEHEMELKRQDEEIRKLSAKEKRIYEETLAATLASHVSAVSLKENRYASARKRTEEVEQALQAAKLEHPAALETLTTDHTATLRVKDTELTETVAKTGEQYHNALTKLRQDHSETTERQTKDSLFAFERLRKNTPARYESQKSARKVHSQNLRPHRKRLSKRCGKLITRQFSRRKPTLHGILKSSRSNTRRLSSTVESHLLPSRRLDRIMPRGYQSYRRWISRFKDPWHTRTLILCMRSPSAAYTYICGLLPTAADPCWHLQG